MTPPPVTRDWFVVENADAIASPALLFYPDRIAENIRRMISVAGDPTRLRPHAKTHKTQEIAALQIAAGIKKFKAATIAEAEMLAKAGADDVLLAMQPVGPNIGRLLNLMVAYPKTEFSVALDDAEVAAKLSHKAQARRLRAGVFLDLDCGQHRTGIDPGIGAGKLYRFLADQPGLKLRGLHAYDGHIHITDPGKREQECAAAFAPVIELQARLQSQGMTVGALVAGGTPTFPIHARRKNVECSPGTCVLWDYGYSSRMPDLDFLHAAVVLTRVVSKPANGRVCLDLGHKSIGSENPHPRVHFLDLPHAVAVSHSEEHLVIESSAASALRPGDCLYGIPWHVCPTVALYDEASVVMNHIPRENWKITARGRRLTI